VKLVKPRHQCAALGTVAFLLVCEPNRQHKKIPRFIKLESATAICEAEINLNSTIECRLAALRVQMTMEMAREPIALSG